MASARSMMRRKSVEKRFWAEAVSTACWLRNRLPTKLLGDVTPYEKMFRKKPNLAPVRVFGCKLYYKNNKNMKKLDDRGREGFLLGFNDEANAFKIWDVEKASPKFSRDVHFVRELEREGGAMQRAVSGGEDRVVLEERREAVVGEQQQRQQHQQQQQTKQQQQQQPKQQQQQQTKQQQQQQSISQQQQHTVQPKFKPQDRVMHEFQLSKFEFRKYCGVVERVNDDGSYQIRFDDDEVVEDMREEELVK